MTSHEIADRDEVLRLLSAKARDGSVSAMIALERALRTKENAPAEFDDELERLLDDD